MVRHSQNVSRNASWKVNGTGLFGSLHWNGANATSGKVVHFSRSEVCNRIFVFQFFKPILRTNFRPRPHVSGYFLIRNYIFPDTASVHTYPVLPAYESPLQNGKCLNSLWIRNRVDAKSRFFFIRWRNKVDSSSLLWIMYSRWKHRSQVLSRQSKMQISRSLRRMLSCQYSQRRPGYKS